MKYFIVVFQVYVFILLGFLVSCSEPMVSGTTPIIQVPPVDSFGLQLDSCENRLLNYRTLQGCPEYVGGYLNDQLFSALADVGLRENLGPEYSIINIRSLRDGSWYAMELGLTFNGTPEEGRIYPLTTDGDDLATWHVVDPDSVYIALGIWLDFADTNPGILYKYVPTFPNWIRIDSSSYSTYEGEPVTDHFGALEATLVLNETEYIQDNVQYYLDLGYCVPDTIFLRDVCFDARTRDVFSPCERVPGR